ncbi:MAG: hypothetical protein K0R34_3360 [Herbinix sp.]|nr:hypothetical protein [Herbinix sp.]
MNTHFIHDIIMREVHSHYKLACIDTIGADDHEYAFHS